MQTIFQTPKRMASFPAAVPVFSISNGLVKGKENEAWLKRLNSIGQTLDFDNFLSLEDREHLYIQQDARILKLFKATGSFHFYDRNLVAPTVPDLAIQNPKSAKTNAVNLIKSQSLLYDFETKKAPFQTFYCGVGYTVAKTANAVVTDKGNWEVLEETESYKTEIQSQFGYKLGGLPVFGPGAKTIISNVGKKISEQIHYWRTPDQIVSEREIVSPETAIARLGKDARFVKVQRINKKYPGQSSGRFYDDVELGYYATPPFNNQRFYIPVYKIRGTFESRIQVLNDQKEKKNGANGTFRYDFTHYVSALHGDAVDFYLRDFKRQIIF